MEKDFLNETLFERMERKSQEPWEVWSERDTVHSEFNGKDWADKDPVLQARKERSP